MFLQSFELDSQTPSHSFFGDPHDHHVKEKTDFIQTQFAHGWRCFVSRAICSGASLAQSFAGICRDVQRKIGGVVRHHETRGCQQSAARCCRDDCAKWQTGLFGSVWQIRPGGWCGHERRFDFQNLFDDQTAGIHRTHDAGGRRESSTDRSRLQISSCFQKPTSQCSIHSSRIGCRDLQNGACQQ